MKSPTVVTYSGLPCESFLTSALSTVAIALLLAVTLWMLPAHAQLFERRSLEEDTEIQVTRIDASEWGDAVRPSHPSVALGSPVRTIAGATYASNQASGRLTLEADINPGAGSSGYSTRRVYVSHYNGKLYLGADDGTTGGELWQYDGLTGTASLAADINPGVDGSFPVDLLVYRGKLFFSADNGTNGRELWQYDDLTGTASLAADVVPGAGSSYPGSLTVYDGKLFFGAYDGTTGRELWQYDGLTGTASLAADINPGSLTVYDGKLFFGAYDGTSGYELWQYDGLTGTASLAADIVPGAGSSYPYDLTVYNGRLFFNANDGTSGYELWQYDGFTGTASLAADVVPGAGSSYPGYLTVYDGKLFFGAADGTSDYGLWQYDRLTGTASLVADIGPGIGVTTLEVYDGRLFFSADDGTSGYELWQYDGLTGTASLAADIVPGAGSSYPYDLTIYDGRLFFSAEDDTSGRELWSYAVTPFPLTTFSDRDAFLSATAAAGLTDTHLSLAGDLSFSPYQGGPASIATDGQVSFYPVYNHYDLAIYWYPNEDIQIDLPSNTKAIGVVVWGFYGLPDGVITVSLSTGDSYTVAGCCTESIFHGIISDSPIAWVRYRLDNDYITLHGFDYSVTPSITAFVSDGASGMGEATLTLKDGNGGVLVTAITQANGSANDGKHTFTDLILGERYTLSVAAEGMTFIPSSFSFASLATDQSVTFSRTNRPGAGEVIIHTAETISSGGGSIALPDGGSLEIPAGSLTELTSFLVGTFEPPPPGVLFPGPVFYFSPSGLEFDPPLTITVHYASDQELAAQGIAESDLRITRYDEASGKYKVVNPYVQHADDNILTASISHFSLYGAGVLLPPQLHEISPVDPLSLGEAVTLHAGFTDPDAPNTQTATWDWGDDTTTACPAPEPDPACTLDKDATTGEGIVTATHAYATAGVYTVTLTLTDVETDESAYQVYRYVVVYDPDGGFVTGGGWIDSPAGAYADDPTLTGKVTFGFVAKYKKGKSTPEGQTQFQFKVADLNFHSSSYDWLVVTNHKAMYKGSGTINGGGDYGFQLSAIDADLTPSTNVDLFRIKIWDKNNNDALVYDNQMSADENADPATAIGGGNIKIHSGGGNPAGKMEASPEALTEEVADGLPTEYALEPNYPNPFNPATTIRFALPEAQHVRLSVFDLMGRKVAHLVEGALPAGWHEVPFEASRLASGVYLYQIEAGAFTTVRRMLLVK